jgi:RimJ/RimL family protein N-acetyltransferase
MAAGLLLGQDEIVAAWAFAQWGLHPTKVDRGFGVIGKDGKIHGAILLQNFNGTNIELSYYGPRTLSPGIVRSIARTVILEFNAARVTVVTSKKNKRLMRSLSRFGFKLEGSQRRYFGQRDCSRNTGVRFVLFCEQIERLARFTPAKQEQGKG